MRSRDLKNAFLLVACATLTFLLKPRWSCQPVQSLGLTPDELTDLQSLNLDDVYPLAFANATIHIRPNAPLHYVDRRSPPQVEPATDEEVLVARCKGQVLLTRIASSSSTPSQWTEIGEVEDYGWGEERLAQASDEFDAVAGALDQFDVPGFRDDSWTRIRWSMNGNDYDGVWYPACDAYYTNVYNPEHGTILATDNEGPAHVDPPQEPLAPLRQWSDVAFLSWQNLCEGQNVDVGAIDRIIRVNIINDSTLSLILAVLKSERGIDQMTDLGDFTNGEEFLPSDDGFDVLLGSPNGNGIAWFLAQHIEQLGEKKISRITVWDNQPQDQRALFGSVPSMMFEFESVD